MAIGGGESACRRIWTDWSHWRLRTGVRGLFPGGGSAGTGRAGLGWRKAAEIADSAERVGDREHFGGLFTSVGLGKTGKGG
jgi:hypothetical protein